MSLYNELAKIGQQVKSQLPQMKNNETATVHVSVLPFIRALGYNTQDLSEVYPEYSILSMDAVDYAVLRDGEPIMFLEAKKAGEKLSNKHWKQLFEYFNADKARIGILTNGNEYRFYTDSVKQNIMDNEPSLTINLVNLDKVAVAQLDGFTKARFHPEHSLRKVKISNLLARELQRPSDEFVRYFAKQIHSGAIWKTVIEAYRPLVKQAWWDLVDREIASRLQRHEGIEEVPAEIAHDPEIKKPDPSVPPGDSNYIPIYGYRDGHRFKAELSLHSVRKGIFLASKAVRYKGEIMRASDAVWNAIRSVDESFDSETWNTEKINSWRFWHVVDPLDGSEREMRLVAGWKHNRDEALYRRILSN